METMTARRILQLGDPTLRAISVPLPDPALAGAVLGDLAATLHEFRRTHGFGRAISAIQIGEAVRVIYMEVDGQVYQLVNPEFLWKSDELFELWDDCFSFPHLMVRLRRSVALKLAWLTPDGARHELEAHGALSELIQHEMDHLDGILAVDRAIDQNSLATREEILRRQSGDSLEFGAKLL
jgi:peptide deformylase